MRLNMKNCGGGTSAKLKKFYGKISYAIWPFVVFIAFLIASYFGNQFVFELRGGEGASMYPQLPIDDKIPLVPWFVYFYYLTFPLGILTFFYVAYVNKNALYNLFYTLIVSFAISGIIYFFWQTYFVKPEFVPVSFTDKLVVSTWGSTNPINCFPSQHSFMAIAMIIGCCSAGKGMNWIFKVFTIFCSIMILLSTFLIKQHYFVDWIASACIMIPAFLTIFFIRRKKEKKNEIKLCKISKKI